MGNTYHYTTIDGNHDFTRNIHRSAVIGKNLTIGMNVIIEENVVIGDNCFIGHNCFIRPGSTLGDRSSMRSFCLIDPDVKIGKDVAIYPHATVGGGTVVEDKVYWGPYTLSTNSDLIRCHRTPVQEEVIKPPLIKKGAILAAGCMIKPGVVVGKNAVLGMGSNLTKSIPDNEIWFGNPAKYYDDVKPEDRIIEDEEEFVGFPDSLLQYHEEMNAEKGM